jgi:glutamate formiminotransferase
VLPLEAVPNVSEGRDTETISALAAAFARDARLLDVHSDEDHHRSVFTLVGDDEALVESLVAGIAAAVERIDLRQHTGVHPRVGAADVVPLVPIVPEDGERAARAARSVAERAGRELGLPVFLYGDVGGGRRPAFFRSGGLDALRRRLDAGELVPDHGPARLHPSAGAVLVGARSPLVAFNVDLDTDDLEVARAIAEVVRERGGGFAGVRALGLALPRSRRVQVSMNVENWQLAPLHDIVARIRSEAENAGVAVVGSELVGLLPAGAALAAAAPALALAELGQASVLELRLLETVEATSQNRGETVPQP